MVQDLYNEHGFHGLYGYEEYSYCSRICYEVRRVDEKLPEAVTEDRREHYPR
jgi:hypothetical protein